MLCSNVYRFLSAPLPQGLFPRVKRDIMEGTWEEMIDNLNDDMVLENNGADNVTYSRVKRQVEIPDIPDLDNTK